MQFYTHLFIGPSAASTNTVTSNSSKILKNCAWGLTEVTPSIIAYIHVVVNLLRPLGIVSSLTIPAIFYLEHRAMMVHNNWANGSSGDGLVHHRDVQG